MGNFAQHLSIAKQPGMCWECDCLWPSQPMVVIALSSPKCKPVAPPIAQPMKPLGQLLPCEVERLLFRRLLRILVVQQNASGHRMKKNAWSSFWFLGSPKRAMVAILNSQHGPLLPWRWQRSPPKVPTRLGQHAPRNMAVYVFSQITTQVVWILSSFVRNTTTLLH